MPTETAGGGVNALKSWRMWNVVGVSRMSHGLMFDNLCFGLLCARVAEARIGLSENFAPSP
jgi:hypothetical protein